jgi:general secretion pathway protein F
MNAQRFSYRALASDGTPAEGELRAGSPAAAMALLTQRGYFPLDVSEEPDSPLWKRSLGSRDLALGLGALATLLESGLPTNRALEAMEQLAPPSWRPHLPRLIERIREGEPLSIALEQSDTGTPPVVIGLVRAGERGSDLPSAISSAAAVAERSAELRASIMGVLLYPAVLGCAGVSSVALLVGFVIPRFAAILDDLGHGLPPLTAGVLATAHALSAVAVPGMMLIALLALLWHGWTRTTSGLRRWHELLLLLPIVGAARLSSATALIADSLAALLRAGVSVAPALASAGMAAADAAVIARLERSRESIRAGTSLSSSLQSSRALTPTAVQLIRLGEESGELVRMLQQVARIEHARTDRLVRTAVRLLEPALVLFIAGVVALIAAALLQAVYAVRPT